MNQAKAVK